MISGIPHTSDPWVAYYWIVNEFKKMGFRDDYIDKLVVKPYVPRETCSNCGFPSYPGRMVKLTSDYKCVECGRGDIFEVVPPPKTMRQEVFEEVLWITDSEQVARNKVAVMYPHVIKAPLVFQKFAWKKTKMTLEWEE